MVYQNDPWFVTGASVSFCYFRRKIHDVIVLR
jgi:hypothetical protein